MNFGKGMHSWWVVDNAQAKTLREENQIDQVSHFDFSTAFPLFKANCL